jgi:citronellol/citronellal dehydrogenase
MTEERAIGLDDAELAGRPTVYAPGALKSQVALISGGSGGSGRAVAWLFARLGAHVVAAGCNEAKLSALVETINQHRWKASCAVVDIRDPTSVASLLIRFCATARGWTS